MDRIDGRLSLKRNRWIAGLGILLGILAIGGMARAADDALERRGTLGLELEPQLVSHHAVVASVGPEGPAAAAGLQPGIGISRVDGEPFASADELQRRIAAHRGGQVITLTVQRSGTALDLRLTTDPFPLEEADGLRVDYGFFAAGEIRLRSLTIRPEAAGERFPAMLLLPDRSHYASDDPGPNPYRSLAHHLAREGFLVMRYDPRGIGDSEGGPWGDVGFDDEVDDARLALRHLRQRDDVDPRRVVLLGWGAGGDLAALVADTNPEVAGVVVWDPAIRPVLERYLYVIRMQMEAMGSPVEKLHRTTDEVGRTIGLIISGADAEECRRRIPATAILWDGHGRFFEKSPAYWRELNEAPLIKAWPRARGPVLLLESEFDVTAPPGDAETLEQELERAYHPDHRLERVPGVDHNLGLVTTFREAINRDFSGDRLPDGIEVLVSRLLPWLRALPPVVEPAAIPTPPAEEDPK